MKKIISLFSILFIFQCCIFTSMICMRRALPNRLHTGHIRPAMQRRSHPHNVPKCMDRPVRRIVASSSATQQCTEAQISQAKRMHERRFNIATLASIAGAIVVLNTDHPISVVAFAAQCFAGGISCVSAIDRIKLQMELIRLALAKAQKNRAESDAGKNSKLSG